MIHVRFVILNMAHIQRIEIGIASWIMNAHLPTERDKLPHSLGIQYLVV